MKLLTDELKTKLLANGVNRDQDHAPVVKFFNPVGSATWCLFGNRGHSGMTARSKMLLSIALYRHHRNRGRMKFFGSRIG
jgi:hypothetical protein